LSFVLIPNIAYFLYYVSLVVEVGFGFFSKSVFAP
jgi:hypothetical protein